MLATGAKLYTPSNPTTCNLTNYLNPVGVFGVDSIRYSPEGLHMNTVYAKVQIGAHTSHTLHQDNQLISAGGGKVIEPKPTIYVFIHR